MTFISYAQNFEDVMLWRALKHVGKGFYLDVGANDPTIDSVTKIFYEKGWNGINIEPIASHFKKLEEERSHDINLCCAVGEKKGKVDIYECEIRGWATGDKSHIKKLIEEKHEGCFHEVSMRTLEDICQENVTGEIHFLKIDVEGFEKRVLQGANFDKYRPWITIIEATRPNSTIENHEDWETDLLNANYHFAYADGLNRFYVAHEQSQLLKSFLYPPNVFDDFVRFQQLDSELRAKNLEVRLEQAENKVVQVEESASQLKMKADLAEERIKLNKECTKLFEAKASWAEERANIAEGKTADAEERANIAEGKTADAEERANIAEGKTADAEGKVAQIYEKISQAANKADEAMSHIQESRREYAQLNQLVPKIIATIGNISVNPAIIQPPPNSLRDQDDIMSLLLSRQDRNFIETAYQTILGRMPDVDGLSHYLDLLRNGEHKIEILGRLRYSPEGQHKKVRLPGLLRLFFFQRLYRIPILGSGLRMISALFHLHELERGQRILENFVFRAFENDKRNCTIFLKDLNVGDQFSDKPEKKNIDKQLAVMPEILPSDSSVNGFVRPAIEDRLPIYVYVDHTSKFCLNTGIQQLIRKTAINWLRDQLPIVFVRLNKQEYILEILPVEALSTIFMYTDITDDELKQFSHWHNQQKMSSISTSADQYGWLFVPEVPYINHDSTNFTMKVIDSAKSFGLKTAFVFYDMTPLIRLELDFMYEDHKNYVAGISDADLIVPISEYSKDNLLRYYAEHGIQLNSKTVVQTLHLGCDFEAVADHIGFELNNYILSVGSIVPHKNQFSLIKAFKSYKSQHVQDKIKLVLAGSVSHTIREELYELIDGRDDIFVYEGKDDLWICSAYQNCFFTVFPSLEEGFGLPIIESLRFNKPCIVADFGAMREISKPGCLNVNIRSEQAIVAAIKRLCHDAEYFAELKKKATQTQIDYWYDYSRDLLKLMPAIATQAITPGSKRIFWLGMHKILVTTELVRLRYLGYEVFNPPYLSHIQDQSANMEWDNHQISTLPANVFKKLAETNFFYVEDLPDEIIGILNKYFDAILVTISPAWLKPILKSYNGTIIYRVYGQSYNLSQELSGMQLKPYIARHSRFYFFPHAKEAVIHEEPWLEQHQSVVPYCLPEDVYEYENTWVSPHNNGEIILTCPNISNTYYAAHYEYLKKYFSESYYKIYGVQMSKVDDPAVVGTLERRQLLESFKNSACYVYTYDDPQVCYLPPIEAMVIGLPVLFRKGSLLDKYYGSSPTPARFADESACKDLVSEIRNGNFELIDEIISYQSDVAIRYRPSYVWKIFDQNINKVIEGSNEL